MNDNSDVEVGSDRQFITLLTELKGAEFCRSLKENSINIENLKYVSADNLNAILSNFNYGSRVIFEYHLKKWQEQQVSQTQLDNEIQKNHIFLGETLSFCLESVLLKTLYGQNVVKFYKINSKLDCKYRKILSSCITNYLLENSITPSPKYFDAIADSISKFFPTECKDIYYIHKQGRKPAGCLYSKYHNSLYKLRKEGLWDSPGFVETAVLENETDIDAAGDESDVAWLKYNIEPYEEVLRKWDETFAIRRKFIKDKHLLIEVIQEWPLLKQSFGHKLIAADFAKLYPGKEKVLFLNWDNFSISFMKLVESQCKDHQSLDLIDKYKQAIDYPDKQRLILQHLIHNLLKPCTRKCLINADTRKKKFIKTTIADSRDAFLIWAPNVSELKSKVKLKVDFTFGQNSTIQPTICAIGNSPFDLTEYFVYFADIYYKVDNIVVCIDMVFKVFHVLNLKYPEECKNVWLFIQQYFFNMVLTNNEKNSVVVTILNDIKHVTV